MRYWLTLLLCLMVAVPVYGSTPVDEHTAVEVSTTHEALDVEARYAPTKEDMSLDVLAFAEKSFGVIEAGWSLTDFEAVDSHSIESLDILRGTGVKDIAKEGFVYGEKAVYDSHGKGLEVIILEFKDIESAKEVYQGILRKLLGQKYISSNEFGYEGYAASVYSPVLEVNGFRRGQFIVQVAKTGEAIHYDVKMMAKLIDNDLKEYAYDDGVIYEFDPFMRLDSNGIVIGQVAVSTSLIGKLAILIGVGTTFIFLGVGAIVFLMRAKIKRPKLIPKIKPRVPIPKLDIMKHLSEEVGGIPMPPKRILAVMALLALLSLVLTVLVLDVVVHYVLVQSEVSHEPGTLPGVVYSAADRVMEIGADGITIRGLGIHLNKWMIVAVFIVLLLGSGVVPVLAAGVLFLVKKRGIRPPRPKVPKISRPKIKKP